MVLKLTHWALKTFSLFLPYFTILRFKSIHASIFLYPLPFKYSGMNVTEIKIQKNYTLINLKNASGIRHDITQHDQAASPELQFSWLIHSIVINSQLNHLCQRNVWAAKHSDVIKFSPLDTNTAILVTASTSSLDKTLLQPILQSRLLQPSQKYESCCDEPECFNQLSSGNHLANQLATTLRPWGERRWPTVGDSSV